MRQSVPPPVSDPPAGGPAPAAGGLLVRVAAGDAEAARACTTHFGALVWALARRYTKTAADAEDAVQDIFVDLWRSAARFDPALASEQAFVAMIARRRLIDLARKRALRATEPLPDDDRPGAQTDASDSAETKVEASLVARVIRSIPEDERRVLTLVTFEGLSQQEIAERLGIPLGTVKTVVRRGLCRVRALLGEGGARDGEEVAT